VAIIGSLAAAVYRSRLGDALTLAHVPGSVAHLAADSVAEADLIGQQTGGVAGGELVASAHQAFVTSMAMGMRVSAAVALAAAAGAFFALPGRRPAPVTETVRVVAPAPAEVPGR
jgi:DHA2 family multidrug resistance protein-like MFS transporter